MTVALIRHAAVPHFPPGGGGVASVALLALAAVILARRPIGIWLQWRWGIWRGRRDLQRRIIPAGEEPWERVLDGLAADQWNQDSGRQGR